MRMRVFPITSHPGLPAVLGAPDAQAALSIPLDCCCRFEHRYLDARRGRCLADDLFGALPIDGFDGSGSNKLPPVCARFAVRSAGRRLRQAQALAVHTGVDVACRGIGNRFFRLPGNLHDLSLAGFPSLAASASLVRVSQSSCSNPFSLAMRKKSETSGSRAT